MDDQKWWLDSQTIQGALVTYVPALLLVLSVFGVKVTDGEAGSIINGIVGLIGAVATTYSIIGRFKADKQVTLKKPE